MQLMLLAYPLSIKDRNACQILNFKSLLNLARLRYLPSTLSSPPLKLLEGHLLKTLIEGLTHFAYFQSMQ